MTLTCEGRFRHLPVISDDHKVLALCPSNHHLTGHHRAWHGATMVRHADNHHLKASACLNHCGPCHAPCRARCSCSGAMPCPMNPCSVAPYHATCSTTSSLGSMPLPLPLECILVVVLLVKGPTTGLRGAGFVTMPVRCSCEPGDYVYQGEQHYMMYTTVSITT